MTELNVDYVLVIFGGVIGYSGDDINKFLWMVRIAEGEHPTDIRESDYLTERGKFRVDLSDLFYLVFLEDPFHLFFLVFHLLFFLLLLLLLLLVLLVIHVLIIFPSSSSPSFLLLLLYY